MPTLIHKTYLSTVAVRVIAMATLAITLATTGIHAQYVATAESDKDKLGRAMEYFQSNKYHEALLLFTDISKRHKLSPRLNAYMGVCCYYDADYESAARYLDHCMESVSIFPPSEYAVYCFCAAESHFHLESYATALKRYEQYSLICHDNERGEALYKSALCYMHTGDKPKAIECFESAIAYYMRFNKMAQSSEKIINARKMIDLCHGGDSSGTTFAE